MKPISGILFSALVLTAAPALAQTEKASWEFSLAGNAGSTSTSADISVAGRTSSDEGEETGYAGLDVRAAYYIVNGFSIEPEIYWVAAEGGPPAFSLGANLAYTFPIPQSPVSPFVIAGYGLGNGIPLMQRIYGRSSDKLDIPVLRLGGGVKFFVSKHVALKAEYRYERYSYEQMTTFFSYTGTVNLVHNFHNVLIGFSVFIPGGE